MSLLRQIQDEAISGNIDLATVLRRCKQLAARLSNDALEQWIGWEADGYPRDVKVPEYRVLRMQVRGHFSGFFGRGLKNAEIPVQNIPEELRELCTIHHARESIHTLEGLLRADSSVLHVPIPPDALRFFGDRIYEGMNCLSVWGELSSSQVQEIINGVRNKVLDFALRIEKMNPAAGEAEPGGPTLDRNVVNQVFQTTVYGGATNIVGTAVHSNIKAQNVMKGNLDSLKRALAEAGVGEEDIKELTPLIKQETSPKGEGRFGPRVSAWIGTMVGKAASGAWKISTSAATTVLTKAIGQYYGIHT